jgi:hypothetical protein
VTYVYLEGEQCDDESLRAACRLPWLEELIVFNTSVTDASAHDLRQLKHLRSLDLRLNRITMRPLQHIGDISDLRELNLSMKLSPVAWRDEDMAFLKRLAKLERLSLSSTSLADAWLAYIEGLKNLKSLQLYDIAITGDGLDHLKGLSMLKAVVTLQGTRVPLRSPNDTNAEIDKLKMHPLIRLNSKK